MRIALVHMRHAHQGGTECVLNQVARHFAEAGHEVTIVCRSHKEPPHPGVSFVVLRSFSPGSGMRKWNFARDVHRHLQAHSYDIVFGLGKTWTQDVLRTGSGSHQTYVEMAQQIKGTPWGRRLRTHWLRDRLAVAIERRAFAPGAYKRIIANSLMVKEDVMRRYDVPEEQIELIYNGVDLERFHPRNREQGRRLRAELGFEDQHFVILFVGRGFHRKGLARLLRAFRELREQRPEAHVVVVGQDGARPSFEGLVAKLGVDDAVHFLGQRDDIDACYGAADLFVLPTYYDSFAYSVAEALATGVPVITTRRAGASELIAPGISGEVLPGLVEPAELVAALMTWSNHDKVRAAGTATRAASERCDLKKSLAAIEHVLMESAANGQSHA